MKQIEFVNFKIYQKGTIKLMRRGFINMTYQKGVMLSKGVIPTFIFPHLLFSEFN